MEGSVLLRLLWHNELLRWTGWFAIDTCISEIDLLSHQTRAVVYPSKKRSESKHRPDGKVETDPQKRSLPTFPPARLRPETDDEV